ncbi:hypothetical protein BpHYR1_035160 [Brachionus plicatilis]|uniref:Uncharacterized protein n=1 Tax=Brachionus plicatilis TaxID=10195 RepID=A0A3M7SDW9_BRAPC|nr:hypothetical protein BpHYR1_035160 [Brachionus plicatilis]
MSNKKYSKILHSTACLSQLQWQNMELSLLNCHNIGHEFCNSCQSHQLEFHYHLFHNSFHMHQKQGGSFRKFFASTGFDTTVSNARKISETKSIVDFILVKL